MTLRQPLVLVWYSRVVGRRAVRGRRALLPIVLLPGHRGGRRRSVAGQLPVRHRAHAWDLVAAVEPPPPVWVVEVQLAGETVDGLPLPSLG